MQLFWVENMEYEENKSETAIYRSIRIPSETDAIELIAALQKAIIGLKNPKVEVWEENLQIKDVDKEAVRKIQLHHATESLFSARFAHKYIPKMRIPIGGLVDVSCYNIDEKDKIKLHSKVERMMDKVVSMSSKEIEKYIKYYHTDGKKWHEFVELVK